MECSSCGASVSKSDDECPQCGEKQGWVLDPQTERIGCGMLLLLLGTVFLGTSFYFVMGQRASAPEAPPEPRLSREERLSREAYRACQDFARDQFDGAARTRWSDEDREGAVRRIDTGLYHVQTVVNVGRQGSIRRVPYFCATRYSEKNRTWVLVNIQLNP